MLLVESVGFSTAGASRRRDTRELIYDDPPVRQHRLEANTGEDRANGNTDYRAAAPCGDRSGHDGSALAAAVSSAC